MKCAPHQYILASVSYERVYRFNNRTRDHPRFDLRVPSQVRRERKMIHHPRDADDFLAVAIARPGKRRFRICREPVNLLGTQARV